MAKEKPMASASAAAPRQRQRRRAPSAGGVRWDKISRIALLATLGVILLLYLSPTKHWFEQSATARDQRSQLRQLTTQHDRLEHQVRTLRDPGALERQARGLGMVREGERSYVIEHR